MSKSFAHTLPENFQLTSTTKILKSLSGQVLPSEGIFHLIPIKVDKTKVYLSFYVFGIWEFGLLIGHLIERLLYQGRKGNINVRLRKSLNLSIPITRSLHAKTELSPKQDPMEEIMVASLLEASDENLEEVTHDFIQEEEESRDPFPLDEIQEPPKPPIVLKSLPSGLKYAFLNNDRETPVIISDKLSEDETLRLLTVLEKHRAAFGYSLEDLKGISPALCTHHIPTDPTYPPSREPQRKLNNAMREVVKKEVLKLLHAGIIYPMSHSEWVSPVQVVPKKGGMTVVKNEKR
jgi:hypothetical protein